MVIKFGRHKGMSLEVLVLQHPDYAAWMLFKESANCMLAEARGEARRLIQIFDERPFVAGCQGQDPDCDRPATRGSVYKGTTGTFWWCDECDPYQMGASPRKLEIVRSYTDVIYFVEAFCDASKNALKALISEMAEAKGLPTRVDENQAAAFFR
jgi:hypothetical protein